MKTIEIIVDPKGQARVETKGFSGGECREASRFVEQALGTRSAETLTLSSTRASRPARNSRSRNDPAIAVTLAEEHRDVRTRRLTREPGTP